MFFFALGIHVVSMFFCHVSFAQNDITLPSGLVLEYQDTLSQDAFDVVKTRFSEVESYLEGIASGLPPEKAEWIEKAVGIVRQRVDQLQSIEVYLAPESAPASVFDEIYAYFSDPSQGFSLTREDLDAKKAKAEAKTQELQSQSLADAILAIPETMISPAAKAQLVDRLQDQTIQAARGKSTSGPTRRISIVSVYASPDPNDPNNFTILDRIAVVIATDS